VKIILSDKFKRRYIRLIAFQQWNSGYNPGIRSLKSTYVIELDVRKPLVVSISQRSEELRLYNLV
jgi:hypothetical protein